MRKWSILAQKLKLNPRLLTVSIVFITFGFSQGSNIINAHKRNLEKHFVLLIKFYYTNHKIKIRAESPSKTVPKRKPI